MRRLFFPLLLCCLIAFAAVHPAALATPPAPTAQAPAVQSDLEKARAALAAKRFQEAIGLAKQAIAAAGVDKTAAPAYEVLASALYQGGDPNGAVTALKQSLHVDPTYVPALFSLGGIAFNARQFPEARQYLEQAIKINPDMLQAHERLALVLQEMGDRAGAIQEYETGLLKTAPDYAGTKFNLAELYIGAGRPADAIRLVQPLVKPNSDKRALMVLANAYLAAGDAKKAVPLYTQALLYDRKDIAVALALGTAQRMAGLENAALDQLKQVVQAAPDSGVVWYQLGLTYAALQRYADAKPALVRAIELEPKSLIFRDALGRAMLAAHEPTAALTVFQEMTKADDAAIGVYDGLANAYAALDRPADAEGAWRDAVKRFPKDPAGYARLGAMLVEHARYEEALSVLGEGNRLAPDEPAIVGDIAVAQWRLGKISDAIATGRRLVNARPKDPHGKFLLATLLEDSGDNAQAITLYREVLADEPDNAQALNNLANCLIDTGEARGAVPLARKAMQLAPDNADIMDTLGWALLKSDQTAEAMMMLKTANGLRPRDPTLMYHLAIAQKQSGDPQAARATISTALQLPGPFKEATEARSLLSELSK